MKGVLWVAVIILLVVSVMVAGCFQLESQLRSGADNPDIISRGIAEGISEFNNPFTSPCESPGFRLISTAMTGDSDSGGGSGKNTDHCYQAIAVNLGDTSKCDNIQRGAPKTKCYCLIASNKNDPTICDHVPSTSDPQAYLKIDCLWEVAIRNNNHDACTAMGSKKISRMFIGEMSQQTCLERLKSGQGVGRSTL
jgi:hypothetical protein